MIIAFKIWISLLIFILLSVFGLRITATPMATIKWMREEGFRYWYGIGISLLIFLMIPYTLILIIIYVWF